MVNLDGLIEESYRKYIFENKKIFSSKNLFKHLISLVFIQDTQNIKIIESLLSSPEAFLQIKPPSKNLMHSHVGPKVW